MNPFEKLRQEILDDIYEAEKKYLKEKKELMERIEDSEELDESYKNNITEYFIIQPDGTLIYIDSWDSEND